MACPSCGCKVTYLYNAGDDEPDDERLERCAACGVIFDIDDAAEEDDQPIDHELAQILIDDLYQKMETFNQGLSSAFSTAAIARAFGFATDLLVAGDLFKKRLELVLRGLNPYHQRKFKRPAKRRGAKQ